MKGSIFVWAVALNIFAAAPLWAQPKNADENLMSQLEERLVESNTRSKQLTGKPKELWLLRQAKIEKIMDRLKLGQPSDPREIDLILRGRVD